MKKKMKKIFIYFVIGFFNIHSFCTEVYGAGEETKPDLSITEQFHTWIPICFPAYETWFGILVGFCLVEMVVQPMHSVIKNHNFELKLDK